MWIWHHFCLMITRKVLDIDQVQSSASTYINVSSPRPQSREDALCNGVFTGLGADSAPTWLMCALTSTPQQQPFAKTILISVKQATHLSVVLTSSFVSPSTFLFHLEQLHLKGRECPVLSPDISFKHFIDPQRSLYFSKG